MFKDTDRPAPVLPHEPGATLRVNSPWKDQRPFPFPAMLLFDLVRQRERGGRGGDVGCMEGRIAANFLRSRLQSFEPPRDQSDLCCLSGKCFGDGESDTSASSGHQRNASSEF